VTGKAADVLTINPDGFYKFKLKASVAHDNDTVTKESNVLSRAFKVTDGDGDTASGYRKIGVNDDAPARTSTSCAALKDHQFVANSQPMLVLILAEAAGGNSSPDRRRACIDHVTAGLGVSERRACRGSRPESFHTA
jgi:hypothetical protein